MADHRAIDPMTQTSVGPDEGQRMQRLRVGLTGLAAVLLVVLLATAIAAGVRRNTVEAGNAVAPPPVVATLPISDNSAAANSEPLAQLGAAPGGNPEPDVEQPATGQ